MDENTWRPLPGFPGYEINPLGDVMNLITGRLASVSRTRGDVRVLLYVRGERRTRNPHNLVNEVYPELQE